MTASDDSQLEEHLLKHYVRQDDESVTTQDEKEDSPFSPLTTPAQIQSPLQKDIHFLVDEIRGQLDEEIEQVLFQIQHPLAGKQVALLKTFVNTVIHARAAQMQREQEIHSEPVHEILPQKIAIDQPIGQIIPSAPLSLQGPTFPDIPHEDEYELSALDAEMKSDEMTVKVIHVPLVLDEERNEIVAAADYNELDGIYRLTEPELDDRQKMLLMHLKKNVPDVNLLRDSRWLQKQIQKHAKKVNVETVDEDFFVLRYYLVRDLAYSGPVSALLNDQKITAIACEGAGVPLTIIREGKKITTTVVFESKDELNAFIHHVAEKTLQKVSVDEPVLDVVYKNFRIQGTLGTDVVPNRFLMTKIA